MRSSALSCCCARRVALRSASASRSWFAAAAAAPCRRAPTDPDPDGRASRAAPLACCATCRRRTSACAWSRPLQRRHLVRNRLARLARRASCSTARAMPSTAPTAIRVARRERPRRWPNGQSAAAVWNCDCRVDRRAPSARPAPCSSVCACDTDLARRPPTVPAADRRSMFQVALMISFCAAIRLSSCGSPAPRPSPGSRADTNSSLNGRTSRKNMSLSFRSAACRGRRPARARSR